MTSKPVPETKVPGPAAPAPNPPDSAQTSNPAPKPEVGGRKGLDPTRYGDWEKDGRCVDF